jgi:PAS domain S-box-containing protein
VTESECPRAELDRLRHENEAQAAELAGLRRARRVAVELEAGHAALRASEARYRLIVESATDYAIFTMDLDRRITGWNVGAERVLGWREDEIVGLPVDVIFTPEDREAGAPGWEARGAVEEGRAEDVRWHMRRDGSRLWANGIMLPLRDDAGAIQGLLKILRDKTAEKRAEEALRESEARFRHLADSAPALIWMTDEQGRVAFANMHFDHVFGRPASERLGEGWREVVLADDRGPFRATFVSAFRARRPFRAEVRVRDRDGQVCWMRCEGVPRLDDVGRFLGYTGCAVDITEARMGADELERRVEERTGELSQALGQLHEEVLEREQAEDALRQAQKMEAVGQLTGGIAHDFNNMLQAIGGSLELALDRMGQGRTDGLGRYLEVACETVERAAALTHRLLAFARRQALQPRPVEPDELVEGMAELIRRTVGPGVTVELRLGDGVWTVLCDPNQIENALLNLAINARDAMPDGGRLVICTKDVSLREADLAGQDGALPGDYVEIAVTDTGSGMDEATRARAFEPFFTTKPIGQGTGLGLSQLYGFVRQSSGIVRLDSAPGRGTTVRLYLPRHGNAGDTEMDGAAGTPQAAAEAGVGRTVLLVEDEAGVREVAAEHLRGLGYRVVEAADGPEALRVLHGSQGPGVDVLVTDVGLPGGLNGRQVAEMARERRPDLPVLFITGYAGSVLEEYLAPGMAVIGKPFALDALAAKVGGMIDVVTAPPSR